MYQNYLQDVLLRSSIPMPSLAATVIAVGSFDNHLSIFRSSAPSTSAFVFELNPTRDTMLTFDLAFMHVPPSAQFKLYVVESNSVPAVGSTVSLSGIGTYLVPSSFNFFKENLFGKLTGAVNIPAASNSSVKTYCAYLVIETFLPEPNTDARFVLNGRPHYKEYSTFQPSK